MATETTFNQMPVIRSIRDFDTRSGNLFERLIFNHRGLVLLFCVLMSLYLGYQALHVRVNASFEKMLPQSHLFMRNYFQYQGDLNNLGSTVRIVVENTGGDIFSPGYLEVLRKVTDQVITTKGANRGWVKSLWLPSVRWTDVVKEGYVGGPVMPDGFDGSAASLDRLKLNVQRAQLVGSLVSSDLKSSMIVVPLWELDPDTGRELDYGELLSLFQGHVRSLETDTVKIHMVGFPVLVGFLIAGLYKVLAFFAVAVVLSGLLIYTYTRCLRSTLLLVAASMLGVAWLLGLITQFGYSLNPYSILVPFLVFAIGISHGAQKMNGIMQDVARGMHKYAAARYTFRRLFLAGLTALLTNIVGFAVLMMVDIPVIREMVLITSIGVTLLIFTKLVLIPVALSYVGVSERAARRRLAMDEAHAGGTGFEGRLFRFLERFTQRRYATAAVLVAFTLSVLGVYVGRGLQVGDLDNGAPELWPNSTYNRDVDFVNRNFGLSSDQLAVIVKTGPDGGHQYDTLIEMQRLGWTLQQDPDVQGVVSLASEVPLVNMGQFEANPKFLTIPRGNNASVAVMAIKSVRGFDLLNITGSVMPVIAYLNNHKAGTLDRVLKTVEAFAREHNSDKIQFLLIAGSAGIEAVTNIVVKQAHRQMLILLYASVIVLCFVTFRNWRAVVVALIPLLITSIIAEAIMVVAGIGLKVATLPVHALGVGVGVDYALYLLSVQLALQRQGATLAQAYAGALRFTGRVVALIGFTMAAAVVTWALSPIKFQADMGILLAFMFLWNMVGALVLIPALSHFLLRSATPLVESPPHALAEDGHLPAGDSRDIELQYGVRKEFA